MTTPKAYCGNCGAEIPLFDNTKKDIGKQCVRLFEQGKEQGKQEERERIIKLIDELMKKDLYGKRFNFTLNGEELKKLVEEAGK